MIITIGSTNQTKVEAVKKIANELFTKPEINCVSTPSNVSEMPLTDEETIKGAINRAKEALKYGKADYGVGIEGGVDDTEYAMFLCAWIAIINNKGKTSLACTTKIEMPEEIANEIRTGKELGPLMDEITGRTGIKQQEGTIGLLTKGLINRSESFKTAITCAFMKFLNKEYYK